MTKGRFYESEVKYSRATSSARVSKIRCEIYDNTNFIPEGKLSSTTSCTWVFYPVVIKKMGPEHHYLRDSKGYNINAVAVASEAENTQLHPLVVNNRP